MKLLRLVMTNFMSTGTGVEVPLDLPGLVLVSGDNQDAEKADSNGCLVGDTLIDCPRDLAKYPKGIPIKDLVGQTPWVYCWKDGTLSVQRASSVHITKKNAPVVRVRLSKYSTNRGAGSGGKWLPPQELVGTADHPVLLSDGFTWKVLGDLVPGDSLCSMYRRESGGWRTLIYWTGISSDEAVSEQQFVCTSLYGTPATDAMEVHHVDENAFNHSPDNLTWLSSDEHKKLHASSLGDRNKDGSMGWLKTGIHPKGFLGKTRTEEQKLKISNSLKINHTVLSIEDAGCADVYDMTVPNAANFIANGVVVHNSGKSSIFGGITYALWGKVPCPPDDTIEADDVVHDGTGKDCKVELEFENDNGSKVRIIRTRKDSASEKTNDLILEVDGVSISASTNEMTQDKINGIFGMDYDTFCTLMPGLGQEIARMTDTNIKELLEKILRTEELSVAHDMAKDQFKALEKEIVAERAQLEGLKRESTQIQLRLISLRGHSESFAEELAQEIAECKTEKSLCASEAREAKKVVERATKAIEAADALDLTASAESVKEAKDAKLVVDNKVKELELKYAKQASAISTRIETLMSDITKFEGLNECPVCLSCVEFSHKEKVIASLRAKIVEQQGLRDTLESTKATATEKYTTKLTGLTSLIGKRSEEHNKLVARQREVELLKKDLVHAVKDFKAKGQVLRKVVAQLEALGNKTNTYATMIETEEAGQRETQTAITALLDSLKVKLEQLALYGFWVKAYSPSGIRSHMMENVVPYLNDRAQYYCDRITAGEMSVVFNTKTKQKTGKVVDKFKIEVSQKHGCKRWKGSSKGERARAALVIALALGDLASMRASKKLSFRAIDEMLDPVDGDGDEAIVSLLRDLESQFGSVYLITHKDRLKNKFQREIIMQKKNGFTTLQGVFEREIH